jgi:hypothetical protein
MGKHGWTPWDFFGWLWDPYEPPYKPTQKAEEPIPEPQPTKQPLPMTPPVDSEGLPKPKRRRKAVSKKAK